MKKQLFVLFVGLAIIAQSCVSKRVLRDSQKQVSLLREDSTELSAKNDNLQSNVNDLQGNISNLNSDISNLKKKIEDLNNEKNALNEQANTQEDQLNKTTQTLQEQRQHLKQLEQLLEQQKRESRALKNKMSEALNGFNSNELTVTQKNGKVYISLSEALLFPSGSAVVNPRGVDALAKLAAVLNLNPDISIDIEGHTDSIPIHGKYIDNWDLSTARANAIVRILVNNYKVDPVRVESSGHSKYDPVDVNSTPQGRARNRRTDIILSPNLDEMYKLLES